MESVKGNPKFETRNPKQIQNSKSEQCAECQCSMLMFSVLIFEFWILNFGFVSDFVFWISNFDF